MQNIYPKHAPGRKTRWFMLRGRMYKNSAGHRVDVDKQRVWCGVPWASGSSRIGTCSCVCCCVVKAYVG